MASPLGFEYFPARASAFPFIRDTLGFDVYLRTSDDAFAQIFEAGREVDADILANYLLKGVNVFYVPMAQRSAFLTQCLGVAQALCKSKEMESEASHRLLDDIAMSALADVFAYGRFDQSSAQLVHGITELYSQIAQTQPVVLSHLLKLARAKTDLTKHMITTSIFATLIAHAHDPSDQNLILASGYAGFVHNIGFAVLTVTPNEYAQNLSAEERRDVSRHPTKGAELMIKNKGILDQVISAVIQHHEAFDGSGYPNKLSGHAISMGGRIVGLAARFAFLIGGGESENPVSAEEAIDLIRKSGKCDPELVNQLAQLLHIK